MIVLLLGVLGLYVEFSTPGLIFPGVAGAILLLLGLTAMALLPLNWLGVSLIVLAIALFVLEAKFTSFGILGAGGAAAMILGALFLVEGPPEFRITSRDRRRDCLAIRRHLRIPYDARYTRRMADKVETGVSGLVGETGIARTASIRKERYWSTASTGTQSVQSPSRKEHGSACCRLTVCV